MFKSKVNFEKDRWVLHLKEIKNAICEINNAEDGSIKALTEKIPALSLIETTKQNGSYILQLEYPKDKDPREELFNYAVESKWILTEMSPHSVNLESIFRTLTMEGGADA